MNELAEMLSRTHRPRLLIRAARFGLAEYVRERDLKRIMRVASPPSPTQAVSRLMATEAEIEDTRRTGGADYSATRHVDVLIALMAEASLLPKSAGKA